LDFDGSEVFTNGRNVEGTAVGCCRKKMGARSYYPLFCTIAQTGQVFDAYHRPGNVHDLNGAREFIRECISIIQREMPFNTQIETYTKSRQINAASKEIDTYYERQ
jgi:hypothetical protein